MLSTASPEEGSDTSHVLPFAVNDDKRMSPTLELSSTGQKHIAEHDKSRSSTDEIVPGFSPAGETKSAPNDQVFPCVDDIGFFECDADVDD